MTALILVLDFGVLAVLKYFRYYLQAAGIFDAGELLIPLGISFYTFQSAAYIFDLYRNKIEPDRSIAKFALSTSFFPQIIRGPISRYDQLSGTCWTGNPSACAGHCCLRPLHWYLPSGSTDPDTTLQRLFTGGFKENEPCRILLNHDD